MKYIIDRFEGDKAILEDEQGETLAVPRNLVPKDASEGDCLTDTDDGVYTCDNTSYTMRKEVMDKLVDDLFI